MEDTMILITGQLSELFARRLIETYKNVSHKMISTWDNTNKEIIEIQETNISKEGNVGIMGSEMLM